MRKIYLFIILVLLAFCFVMPLSAQFEESEDVTIDRQIELYGISENNTIKQVSEIVDISIDDLKKYFKIDPRIKNSENRTLKSLQIDPERVIIFKDDTKYGFNHNYTLFDVCDKLDIPKKKLLEYMELGIQDQSNYTKRLHELGKTPADIIKINEQFLEDIPEFGAILTILGMLVVFAALFVTSIIISQLAHFNIKKKTVPIVQSSIQTPIGEITTTKPQEVSSASYIAVITAIHKRRQELEEEAKVLLTWKRAAVSMWQASGKTQFPNAQFRHLKK